MPGPLNPLLPLRRARLDRSLIFRRRTDRLRRNPEIDPVEPRLPGTRDKIVAPRRRTDPKREALSNELGKVDDEIKRLEKEEAGSTRLGGDPIRRNRIRDLMDRRDKILLRLFTKRV